MSGIIDRYNHHRPRRGIDRHTPASRYIDQPKATVLSDTLTRHDRIRADRVHTGKITLRYERTLRKLYIGRRYDGLAVLAVCLGPDVTVVDRDAGAVLAAFVIDPAKVCARQVFETA